MEFAQGGERRALTCLARSAADALPRKQPARRATCDAPVRGLESNQHICRDFIKKHPSISLSIEEGWMTDLIMNEINNPHFNCIAYATRKHPVFSEVKRQRFTQNRETCTSWSRPAAVWPSCRWKSPRAVSRLSELRT
jgi:hypothetical protein